MGSSPIRLLPYLSGMVRTPRHAGLRRASMEDAMSGDFDGTTITRAGSRDRFTVVHNRTIEDDRLSFRALGLLVFILSKPDNWKTHVNHLATTHTEGREAVRSALTELETCGYVERKWMRGEGEATPSVHYLVSELPGCPGIGNPENRAPRIRDSRKPATSNEGTKEVVKTDSQQTLIDPRALDCFDAFWKEYPRKASKGEARKAWPKALRAVNGNATRIVQGAIRYRNDPNRADEFTKHPGPWLNAECWDDDPLPPTRNRPGGNPSPPPPPPPTRSTGTTGWNGVGASAMMTDAEYDAFMDQIEAERKQA